jgi:hypothetical protein
MLTSRQLVLLANLGAIFWALATAQIHWMPSSFSGPVAGVVHFAASVPAGWLSVWITRRCASLTLEQLPLGILVAGGVAMMIDGAVLHWAPRVYAEAELTARLGAAWLLWGYGVAFIIAFLLSNRAAAQQQRVSTVAR